MINPVGGEIMRARVGSFLAEAAQERQGRRARSRAASRRVGRSTLRVRLGLGLVGAGFRILGDAGAGSGLET